MIKLNLRTVVIFLFLFTVFQVEMAVARPNIQGCPNGQAINKSFASGVDWGLCWEEKSNEGIVLSNIFYTTPGGIPRRVLGEASLSQIQTDFDDGSTKKFVVTSSGLGGSSLVDLLSEDCPGGQLLQDNGKSVLCNTTQPMGYIWNSGNLQRQGEFMELYSISKIDTTFYIVRWRFLENGIIQPSVGLSGSLSKFGSDQKHGWAVTADNRVAIGFTNHYFWRLDFDLESDNDNDLVEQIESVPSADRQRKRKELTSVSAEAALSLNPERKRFWRVRDGSEQNTNVGYVSYELVLLNYGHQGKGNNNEAWLANDFFVTLYDECERFAVKNSTQNGCAENVSQFVNGQNTNQKDIVVWYRASSHHLPRDEDIHQIGTRWTGLQLLPRDWSSKNPL